MIFIAFPFGMLMIELEDNATTHAWMCKQAHTVPICRTSRHYTSAMRIAAGVNGAIGQLYEIGNVLIRQVGLHGSDMGRAASSGMDVVRSSR
jgi:hypothetical protein